MAEGRLQLKAAEYMEKALEETGAAFDFGLILSIITALAPVITRCFEGRVKRAIRTGSDQFVIANFSAAHKAGMSPPEAVAYALEMKEQCASAADHDIEEFISLCETVA